MLSSESEKNEGRSGDLLMGLSPEAEETPIQSEIGKYKDIEKIFNETIDIALASTARLVRLKQVLESTKEELLKINVVDYRHRNESIVNGGEERVVLDPQFTIPKGRPRGARFRSINESRGRRNMNISPIPASPRTLHTIYMTRRKNNLVLKNEVCLMLECLIRERGADVVKTLALMELPLLKSFELSLTFIKMSLNLMGEQEEEGTCVCQFFHFFWELPLYCSGWSSCEIL
ncbi:hypothetical protein M9H77_07401 [Catharanthus roseus]|uniref:Uncharacterized protein n=1 Tax=Catharanthus roseus TaxID=4058 RepID=A0ACC0BV27_CATRO|nr:hypothetical protein M9H77_07401 [Catharanthus roseus]